MSNYGNTYEHLYGSVEESEVPKVFVLDKSKINTLEDVISILGNIDFKIILRDKSEHPLGPYLKRFGG